MKKPLWALASGCVPDALPWEIPKIAASAGFLSSGMWVDPETTWTNDALKKTKASIRETNIELIDVEVIWLEKTKKATDKNTGKITAKICATIINPGIIICFQIIKSKFINLL